MVLGYGDSISYDQLVQRITGDTLDKSNRFTDWTRRPLIDGAAQLCGIRRDTSARRLSGAVCRSGPARPRRLGGRRDGDPNLARHLPGRAGTRLAAAQDPRAQAQGAGSADRSRGLARARGAGAATCRARACSRTRTIGDIAVQAPTTLGEPRRPALAAQGLRALEVGRGHPRSGQARPRRAIPKTLPQLERPKNAPNGAATVELLKVLLRMTSESHGVAAKVIATVDDLDRIAGDDNADVPALKGWRRELFGERALALKHGKLALAIHRGRVVTTEPNG